VILYEIFENRDPSGRLTFDEALTGMSPHLQDYVIVHELIHFRVPNHGKLWKSLMRAHLGENELIETELKRIEKKAAV